MATTAKALAAIRGIRQCQIPSDWWFVLLCCILFFSSVNQLRRSVGFLTPGECPQFSVGVRNARAANDQSPPASSVAQHAVLERKDKDRCQEIGGPRD
jgi:hypothetical protein